MEPPIFVTRNTGPGHQYNVHLTNGDEIPRGGRRATINSPHVALDFSIPTFGGEKKQEFSAVIKPKAFADLALEMMKVDPQEAIKAFGKAMQEIKIPMPDRK
jgi:hypothetical protein